MFNPRKLFTYLLNKIPSKGIFDFYFSRMNPSNFGMVLTLHRVTKPANGTLLNNFIEITDRKLEETILNLQKLNVQFISLGELQGYLNQEKKPKRPLVHVSFDDGYLDNFTIAYPILKKYKVPFSIFVTSDFIGNDQPFLWWYIIENIIKNEQPVIFEKYGFSILKNDYLNKDKINIFEEFRTFILEKIDRDKNYFEGQLIGHTRNIPGYSLPKMMKWDDLKTIVASGLCQLGIHTKSHSRFKHLSKDEKIKEILDCRDAIHNNIGIVSEYFAFPYGSKEDIGNTEDTQEILNDFGIRFAFTTIPAELNKDSNKLFLPRVFINDTATMYTLKSRLNGSYQREILKK